MKEKKIATILRVASAAAMFLLSMNACGTFLQNPQLSALRTDCSGSACFADDSEAQVALLTANLVTTQSVNDYLAQCGEQARMLHHEVQNCREVEVITVGR